MEQAATGIVDFGPGVGELGGAIVAQGTPGRGDGQSPELDSRNGAHLSGPAGDRGPGVRRPPRRGPAKLVGGSERRTTFQNLTVEFARRAGALVAVTGVSGAGSRPWSIQSLPPGARPAAWPTEGPGGAGRHKV